MLQIIGWMGCFYLALKGYENLSRERNRNSPEEAEGRARKLAIATWIGAAVFAAWLYMQANGMLDPEPVIPDRIDLTVD